MSFFGKRKLALLLALVTLSLSLYATPSVHAATSDPSIGPGAPFYFNPACDPSVPSTCSEPKLTTVNGHTALQLTSTSTSTASGAAWHALNYNGAFTSASLNGTYTRSVNAVADGFTIMLFAQNGTGSLRYMNNSIPGVSNPAVTGTAVCGAVSSTGIQGGILGVGVVVPASTRPYLVLQWDPFYGGAPQFNLWIIKPIPTNPCFVAANPGSIGCSIGVPAAFDTIRFDMNYTSSTNTLGARVADMTSGTNCNFKQGLSTNGFSPPTASVDLSCVLIDNCNYWVFVEGTTGGGTADWTVFQVTSPAIVAPPPPPPTRETVAKSFTLLSPTLPAGQTFVPLSTVLTWRADYVVANTFTTPITSVVLSDHFAASLAVDTSTIAFSAPAGSGAGVPVFTTSTSQQPQSRFTWSIGALLPGQTATLSVQVHTTTNPKGIQEFTQPGLQILNSGATLKWIPPSGIMDSTTTLPVFVMAGNKVGAITGVVTSAGSGVQGVTVTLTSGGVIIATATTSDLGFYHFDVVAPGTYTVSATTSTGTASATVTVTAGAITNQQLSTF